ncbi:MAG TPA: nicotinamide riboside transporter PnuC [Gemmatimonadaceae bacterium]|nr:nicotinamide riboside transporter PnuC [Gemmatimonadaceae bacterium]
MPLGDWISANWFEIVAAITGATSVFLSARQNIWSWPTAIVNVSLYTVVFYREGLYSDTGLQVVYLILSIYGWHQWLYGGAQHSTLKVSRASHRMLLVSLAAGVGFWLAVGTLTSRLPGSSLSYLDAALTTTSLVAQWMMTRKILENWILWIIADLVYVPMFLYKGLYVTAALYAVFLALAIMGFVSWRRSWTRDRPATAPAIA